MKKIISVLLVMLVVASVFAVGSVKVGGTFGFDVGNGKLEDEGNFKYKQHGFGFSVAGAYDVSEDLEAFVDFTMLFTNGIELKFEDDTSYTNVFDNDLIPDDAKKTKLNYSVAAGVKYDLGLNLPFTVKVGGGLFFERLINKLKATAYAQEYVGSVNITNFGVVGLAEAEYEFADGFGAVLSIMPRVGLVNSFKSAETLDGEAVPSVNEVLGDTSCTSVKLGFSMPVCVGVVYHF